jgi:hypothetical protein
VWYKPDIYILQTFLCLCETGIKTKVRGQSHTIISSSFFQLVAKQFSLKCRLISAWITLTLSSTFLNSHVRSTYISKELSLYRGDASGTSVQIKTWKRLISVLKMFCPNLSENTMYLHYREFCKQICAIVQNNLYISMCLNTLSTGHNRQEYIRYFLPR